MGPRISAGQNCPGGGHVRGTDAARTTQARARAKTAPRSTLIGGFHQRRLWTGFAGAHVVGLHGSDKVLGCLGQPDQMDPAGHVAIGEAARAELLRTEQGRLLRRRQGSGLADVSSQPQCAVLHIGGSIG